MNHINVKKYSSKITKSRSLAPDRAMIFFAAVLSLTVIGLPLAYGIIKEYHAYLNTARENFDPKSKNTNTVYEYRKPLQTEFSYSGRAFVGALKAILYVFSPGECFVGSDKLNENENFSLKLMMSGLKQTFVEIFIGVSAIITCIVLMFFTPELWRLIELAAIAAIVVVLFRPFVTYCQALVVFEKLADDEVRMHSGEENEER